MPEVADALSRLTGENKVLLLEQLKAMTNKEEIKQQIFEMESLKGDADEEDDKSRKSASDDDTDDELQESDE
jgi:hypothetical protein